MKDIKVIKDDSREHSDREEKEYQKEFNREEIIINIINKIAYYRI